MSLVADAAADAGRTGVASVTAGNPATLYRVPVYLGCMAVALLLNYLLGKEMAWDTLSYHLYAGFNAIHDRFSQDYFAAGPQSYFNPYALVPFYVLATCGLSALQAASILAAVHALILCLTFELALTICPAGSRRLRLTIALCSVALAAANPVLIQQLGSSFTDLLTAELVLAAWVLLARAVRTPRTAPLIVAAVLLGAAVALKPTNAVHALAVTPMLFMLQEPVRARLRRAALYAGAAAVTVTVIAAPWAWRLEHRFGNPFFPLLNNVFRSPEFTTEPLPHYRFIPSGLGEALWRPFAMLDPVPMIHEELSAPDLRYALLLGLACLLGLRWLLRSRTRGEPRAVAALAIDTRVLAALGCAFAIDWVLWLLISGNSRYFLVAACAAAVLAIGLLFCVFPRSSKTRNYILLAVFAAQLVQLWLGAELRWNGIAWDGGRWFEVEVPKKLASEPSLYLTMGVQTNSYVAPYLSRQAGLVNFAGGYPLATTGPNGARVLALIQRYTPHLRVLAPGRRLYADSERRSPSVSEVNGALGRFGLRADPRDCATITVRGRGREIEVTFVGSQASPDGPTGTGKDADTGYLVSCALVPDGADHSAELVRQREADIAFDHLEDACPELFQPRRPPTDARGTFWRRIYMNTDLVALVSNGQLKFMDAAHAGDMVVLGRVSDWVKSPPPLACGRRNGRQYFARREDLKASS